MEKYGTLSPDILPICFSVRCGYQDASLFFLQVPKSGAPVENPEDPTYQVRPLTVGTNMGIPYG